MLTNAKLYAIIALGAMLFVSTGYAWVERGWRQSAELQAATLKKQVESRDRAMAELQAEIRAAQARARRFERVRQDVATAPDSRACASSPAVSAALRGLFSSPAGAAGYTRRSDGASAPSAASR